MHTYGTWRYEVLTKIHSCPGSLQNIIEITLEKNQPIENIIITFSNAKFKVSLVLSKWLPIHLRQMNLLKVRGRQLREKSRARKDCRSRSFILCCFYILWSTPTSPGHSDEHLHWMSIHWMLAILHRKWCSFLVWIVSKAPWSISLE